jgi:hypothetical protein
MHITDHLSTKGPLSIIAAAALAILSTPSASKAEIIKFVCYGPDDVAFTSFILDTSAHTVTYSSNSGSSDPIVYQESESRIYWNNTAVTSLVTIVQRMSLDRDSLVYTQTEVRKTEDFALPPISQNYQCRQVHRQF